LHAPPTPLLYTPALHDALPISATTYRERRPRTGTSRRQLGTRRAGRTARSRRTPPVRRTPSPRPERTIRHPARDRRRTPRTPVRTYPPTTCHRCPPGPPDARRGGGSRTAGGRPSAVP